MSSSVRPTKTQRFAEILHEPSVRYALILFIVSRLFLTLWAIGVLAVSPLPKTPDEILRPYLAEPPLDGGLSGALLGPWQRFDTLRYLRIARQGYAAEQDSVFPPVYPLAMRGLGIVLAPLGSPGLRHLLAGLLFSNVALVLLLILLFKVTAAELNTSAAVRTLVYLTFFPTGFFLLAGYTESLFILLALAAIWQGRKGRFVRAGLLGLLASLTRLTGWILFIPLAFEYLRQRDFKWRRIRAGGLAVFLPPTGLVLFIVGRWLADLPPLADIYQAYWHQTTSLPGIDLVRALGQMAAGEATFTLYIDFFSALFLIGTTILVFRRLSPTYGLYSLLLLFFMLLPTSEQKALFSFSRYALAFFPTFMVLGQLGQNAWLNRLILYPSVALYLYFSGQFFVWGWVA